MHRSLQHITNEVIGRAAIGLSGFRYRQFQSARQLEQNALIA
jgi:hypothetical protein